MAKCKHEWRRSRLWPSSVNSSSASKRSCVASNPKTSTWTKHSSCSRRASSGCASLASSCPRRSSRSKKSSRLKALASYLADARSRVDQVLAATATRDEVVRYSLLGEGKRLRPTLVFAAHEALNGSSSVGVAELAAAVEVVHAYSLVHDDLPCMDNDDLRRGRPTAHRAFDVARATRAGYDMVALAARVMEHGLSQLDLAAERRREIALELFRAAGAGGVIGGPAPDLQAQAKTPPGHAPPEGPARKTRPLIAAARGLGGLSPA